MQNLSIRDLLNARLVSKEFVQLSSLESLTINLPPWNPNAIWSLMLFMSRHCNAAGSAKLNLTIYPFPEGAMYPGIMLATSCANLSCLDCSHEQLELSAAQTCLRLIPGSLGTLHLFTRAGIVEDDAWGRLTALRNLELKWSTVFRPVVYPGTGLMLLTRLSRLIFANNGGRMLDQLDGSRFEMSNLRSLTFHQDPFSGRPDLSKSPNLEFIYAASTDSVPRWLKGQALKQLILQSSSQLVTCDLLEMQCRQLDIYYREGDPSLDVSTLLALPSLKHFEVKSWPEPMVKSPMQLRCLATDYHRFMNSRNLTMKLHVPVDLFLQHSEKEAESRMRLRSNGHPQACRCSMCESQ